jgi:carboxylesterase type B
LPVANPKNCDIEHALLQHGLPHPEYTFSDTECLRLHVTVPHTAHTPTDGVTRKYPVVVFVHGGNFVTGSSSWPQWDLARLVELGIKVGRPIVGVGIK